MRRNEVSALNRVVLAAFFGVTACTSGADAPTLAVVATQPPASGEHAANRPIRLEFDRYLYPVFAQTGAEGEGIRLVSGDIDVPLEARYDVVGRALELAPREALSPGVGYRLDVAPGAVFGLGGETLAEPISLGFWAGLPELTMGEPQTPLDFERDVAVVWAGRCGCHGPAEEGRVPPALTEDALVGQPSVRFPGLALVQPGQPLRSALVRKLLPDYPGLRGEAMPPSGPLEDAALRRVLAWIEGL
jgi:hypothetical protein